MRKFTIEQYKKMAASFNKMSFTDKIKTIQSNTDILTLASDGNWWGVKVKDTDIQEQLEEDDCNFAIEDEWGASEKCDLISLLGIGNTDI